jgi:TIR domain
MTDPSRSSVVWYSPARMATAHSTPPESMLYIVHAAADRDLAILLRARIKDLLPGLQVFLASKAGEIPTGEDWLAHIHQNLKAATSFLLLLTPRSVDRHWVWYEAGVAWSRGCRRLPVTAGGLDRATVHYPLKAAQILDLEQPDDAAQLFRDLGAELESPETFVEQCGPPYYRLRDRLPTCSVFGMRWLRSMNPLAPCCDGCWLVRASRSTTCESY